MAFSGLHLSGSDLCCRRIPMLLSITTREIGLNLCSFYAEAIRCLRKGTKLPGINAVYRELLAIVETKLRYLGIPPRKPELVYPYVRLTIDEEELFWIPETLQKIVDAIGEIEIRGGINFPAMSENTEINGQFEPRPENIFLSNLREILKVLADADVSETAVLHRNQFYKNNPIPAAEWGQNHSLLNPETIMPAAYNYDSDLQMDLSALHSLRSLHFSLTKNLRLIRTERAKGTIVGIVMSSQMTGLLTPDLISGETLSDYYYHAEPENDTNTYKSFIKLSNDEHRAVARVDFELEESKLTIAQRQKTALKLREKEESKTDSELLVRMPLVRPRTSRRRSLSAIRESGIFDTERYRPLKRGEDREKMKERLANTMAYGDNQDHQVKAPTQIMKRLQPQLPTSKKIWNELVTQIRERTEWLAEMEYLGQADPHRDIIKDQIAERMRALDALGIDDSECSTPKSAASGYTLRYQEHESIGQRSNSSVQLEESKLTIAQRQKTALKLREKEESKTDSELLVRMPLVRPRTSRRRSLSAIRESGIFDTERYRPLKRGEDREKMKERLANTMAYGDNQDHQVKAPTQIMKRLQPQLPTSKQIWNELVTQIRERTEWLAEMEYLGQADPHRDIIKDQIAERMRALDALGIDDSECSTPKSAASGYTLRYQEHESIGQRSNSSVSSSRSDKEKKKLRARNTTTAQKKEENVSAYSQLSPLQYSPRRRQ